jgi:hypothetical protein
MDLFTHNEEHPTPRRLQDILLRFDYYFLEEKMDLLPARVFFVVFY